MPFVLVLDDLIDAILNPSAFPPDGPRRWISRIIWGTLILGGAVVLVIAVAQTF